MSTTTTRISTALLTGEDELGTRVARRLVSVSPSAVGGMGHAIYPSGLHQMGASHTMADCAEYLVDTTGEQRNFYQFVYRLI